MNSCPKTVKGIKDKLKTNHEVKGQAQLRQYIEHST